MLRKLTILTVLIGLSSCLFAQPVKLNPQVDRRVELLSIVFRLAGNDEYNGHQFGAYVNDIHRHFDAHKNHPAVAMARQLAQDNGVGYDAVMSMAIHLEQPPSLKPIMAFSKAQLDKRWGATNAESFAKLLQRFYQDARCQAFFDQHEAMYQTAITRFGQVLDKVDQSWYKQYYGTVPAGKFNVVIGVGNGGGNFGPKVIHADGQEEIYAIMGTWAVDSLNNPTYEASSVLPIIIHEFNHSFVNSLIDAHEDALESSGNAIFPQVADQMRRQAYGNWKTMYYESLVRASVVRYLARHDPEGQTVWRQVRAEEANGFIWTQSLTDLLEEYEKSRDQFPTLASFMPRIVEFFDKTAADFPALRQAYDQKRAHVVAVEPLADKTIDVDPTLTELVIRFDKPMNPKKISINMGEKGKEHFPLRDMLGFSNDNRSLRLKVALKPNWEYSFKLTDRSFQTTDGYPLVEHEVAFKTGK
ncbi:hypothetical protein BN8_00865 [Fibrisoma limi BUZ 3]|uniref:DUF4932 domain-containing protein n=1 Tax=Fibrisoma limi BUZ 3 TaxID=1185876 RepID=I2GDD3_9BACT|nr:DUF4932 domain-containing protein [Fibrisoma limi]CCH51907.1 hypothetical protein BN8_00865 [Fibrisoma limi BUZ 3]